MDNLKHLFITLQDNLGSVKEVSNEAYKGTTSIRCIQIYDASYDGDYQSEVVKNGVYSRGDEGFYGFAFRLQPTWEFTSQSYILAQFRANFGCTKLVPTSRIWLVGNQLYSRVNTGSPCSATATVFPNLATVSADDWHRVVIHASWKSGATGFYKVWFDGEKVLDVSNIATTVADDTPLNFRIGLNAISWTNDGGLVGTQSTRKVWIDQIGAGSTYEDAGPGQWT